MYDFQSPKQKTAIRSQETEPRPSNIIRIDQNLPGTRLDRLITEEMAQILNAMSDASGRRDNRCRQIRAHRGAEGYRAGHYERSLTARAGEVAREMEGRRLKAAANCLREGVGETTTYLLDEFPDGHRRRIRTNNMIERPNREIRRRTRVVGSFPDGNSALMLGCARIRYVTANEWSTRRYLDMSRLDDNLVEANRSSRHGRP